MKTKYQELVVKLLYLDVGDVITASNEEANDNDGEFIGGWRQ